VGLILRVELDADQRPHVGFDRFIKMKCRQSGA
jgi:hypothetical protein